MEHFGSGQTIRLAARHPVFKNFLIRHRRRITSGQGPEGTSQRVRNWLHRSGCLTFKREAIARGIGIGLLVGLTPTVGLQTGMMLAGCLLVRGNFPAAFAISWVSNPFTLPPMIIAYHELGEWLFGSWVKTLFKGTGWVDEALIGIFNTALGTILIAIPIALIGYFTSLGVSEVWHRRRHQARRQRREASQHGREIASEDPEQQ